MPLKVMCIYPGKVQTYALDEQVYIRHCVSFFCKGGGILGLTFIGALGLFKFDSLEEVGSKNYPIFGDI